MSNLGQIDTRLLRSDNRQPAQLHPEQPLLVAHVVWRSSVIKEDAAEMVGLTLQCHYSAKWRRPRACCRPALGGREGPHSFGMVSIHCTRDCGGPWLRSLCIVVGILPLLASICFRSQVVLGDDFARQVLGVTSGDAHFLMMDVISFLS